MFSDVLQNIEGVEIFPIISLVIFFVFFLAVIRWTMKLDKKLVDKLSRIPLEDNEPEIKHGEADNE